MGQRHFFNVMQNMIVPIQGEALDIGVMACGEEVQPCAHLVGA